MKLFIPVLIVALVAAGCSPKGDTSASESPGVVAADLGKTEEYFKGLYGAPKSEKQVGDYSFSLPGHGSMVGLTRPLTVQQYERDRLKATVVYAETPRRAIWVKYVLPGPWTQEQIKAALGAYGPEWKVVQENLGMDFIMHERAPVVYSSRAGSLAYKTMFNELIVYAPQLYADLLGQIEEGARQKRAVPKF